MTIFLQSISVALDIVNYLTKKSNVKDSKAEFLVYMLIGIGGLIITEILMYVLTDKLGLYFMISKILVTAATLVWNYSARKIILYK